jgi:hypothetical protein
MSIINDALKKTQDSLEKKDPVADSEEKPSGEIQTAASRWERPPAENNTPALASAPQSAPETASAPAQKPQTDPAASSRSQTDNFSRPKWKTALSLVLYLIIVAGSLGLLVYMFNTFIKPKANTRAAVLPPTPIQRPVQPQTQKPAIAPIVLPGQIEVNGIMTMDDKNVALINNEIREVGDTVNGMKITAITIDSVEVLDGEQVKTFSVRK